MDASLQKLLVPHPVYRLPATQEEARVLMQSVGGAEKFPEWARKRWDLIQAEKVDPLRYGHELAPIWKDARELLERGNDLLILGGNRSGKTEFGAKYANEIIERKASANAWCFQSNERASIERLQPYVNHYLPAEQRDLGKIGKITYIKYNLANGFSEGRFVKPNGSFCRFMNYEMDPRSLEGAELDIAWCDEMVPPDVLDTLRFRLVTRGGKLIVTFTPLEGYSVSVKQYLEGARVIKSLPAPLLPQNKVLVSGCPKGQMPYILECAKPGRFVICFFTECNPWAGYDNLVKQLSGATESDIKCRAYGWPTKMIAGAFPKFGDVNIITDTEIPAEGTNYLLADPHGARNWFMVWVRVTNDDPPRYFVYREWPGIELGEWALPAEKADGKEGPGQRADAGRGVVGYKRLILELEKADEQEVAE